MINQVDNVFDLIYFNINSVPFPINWSRIIPSNSKSVIFSKVVLNEGDLHPFFERSVCIDEQATIKCSYMNYIINPDQLDLNCLTISNIQQLDDVIQKVDSAITCEGFNVSKELLKYKTNMVHVDSNSQFRHSNCTIVVNNSISSISQIYNKAFVQCKYCKTAPIKCQKKKNKKLIIKEIMAASKIKG